MKKLIATLLTVLACGAVYALPIGNPSDPALLCDGLFFEGSCCLVDICDPGASWCEAFSFRAGFYGDYVFQRSMEIDRHESSDFIENTEIFTNAGLLVVNIWDRLDIFATFGATNIEFDTNVSAFKPVGVAGFPPGNRIDLVTETAFSWSIGAKAIVWQCGCTTLGVEGQYFFTKPDIERVTVASTNSIYPDDNINLKYWEWQFGVALSHRINMLIPYVGVKWSRAKAKMDNALFTAASFSPPGSNLQLYDLRSRKEWGYAIGVTLVDCQKLSLNVEARFGDEKAVHVNGQIRF